MAGSIENRFSLWPFLKVFAYNRIPLHVLVQPKSVFFVEGIRAMMIDMVVGFTSVGVCFYVLVAICCCISTYPIQELSGDALSAHVGCNKEADHSLGLGFVVGTIPQILVTLNPLGGSFFI